MTSTLSGTVAVVTGASNGIGAPARKLRRLRRARGPVAATACKPSPLRPSGPAAPRWW